MIRFWPQTSLFEGFSSQSDFWTFLSNSFETMENSFCFELFMYFPSVIEVSGLVWHALLPSVWLECLCVRAFHVWIPCGFPSGKCECFSQQTARWSTRAPESVVFPQIGDLPIPFGQNHREVPWPWPDATRDFYRGISPVSFHTASTLRGNWADFASPPSFHQSQLLYAL